MKWRILYSPQADAAQNMAIDEALLKAQRDRFLPPTLRFYGWRSAALSIGCFQRIEAALDLKRCEQENVSVIRRLSGGRALLHEEELSYSVVLHETHPLLPETITASQLLFSTALLAGLKSLGVDATLTLPQAAYGKARQQDAAACLALPSNYGLSATGRRLSVSAQVRKEGVLLQHGSLLLASHAGRLAKLLRLETKERDAMEARLTSHTIGLAELLGRTVAWQEAAQAIEGGFKKTFAIETEAGALSAQEEQESRRLAAEKYACAAWTMCR